MRVLAASFVLVWSAWAALAQGSVENLPPPAATAAKPAAPATAAAKPKAKPKAKPAGPNLRDAYAAISVSERMAIQSDLTWTGDYNGLINGEFSDRLVASVKAFQKRNKNKDTGVLNPQERAALAAAARPRKDEVGWQVVEDAVTGIRLGLPRKLASRSEAIEGGGTRWSSQQGQLQIETFSVRSGATLEAVLEQQKKEPATRRVSYNVLRPDFFVVAGMQGLKKFYVRAFAKNGEVRGMTILYDQAMDGTMDPIVIAMSSAFAPFGNDTGSVPDRSAPRRKVEYATGVVVSAAGHLVTDRQAIDGCNVVVVPGLGHAERLAETGELALLRIYGARNLSPLALAGATSATAANATLVGVADPQAQGGGAAVSSVAARVSAANSPRLLEPAPASGFSGAAALDNQGRAIGLVAQRAPVVAGPASGPQAALVPAETLIGFLEANRVAPASGRHGLDAAKSAVVRVICVRK